MLKKEFRLKSFSLTDSRQFSSLFFNVKIAKNGKNLNRFAFVVSKKIDSRATVRNELKRKVRSLVEEIFDNIKTGNDFIFYPKKQAEEADRALIFQELNEFFKKVNLLKK